MSSNKIFLVVSRKFEKFSTVHCMFFVVEQFTNFFCMIQSNVIDWWSIQKRPVGDILSLCTRACHLKWTKRSFFLPPFSSLFFPKAVLLVLSFPFVRTRPASFAKKDLSVSVNGDHQLNWLSQAVIFDLINWGGWLDPLLEHTRGVLPVCCAHVYKGMNPRGRGSWCNSPKTSAPLKNPINRAQETLGKGSPVS